MPDSIRLLETIFDQGRENFLYFWEISGVIIAVIVSIFVYVNYRKRNKLQNMLKEKLALLFYSPDELEYLLYCYVPPDCRSFDPIEDPQKKELEMSQESFFKRMERFLSLDAYNHSLLLLADPGMGKTAFLINYYIYNQRLPKRKRHLIEIVALNSPEAEQYISQIPNKKNTILFLDGFDEDIQAIPDRRRRVRELMERCQIFKRVLITCCKQYFPGDETDSEENGIISIHSGQKNMTKDYKFWKMYLLPFREIQIQKYLWKRYPLWKWIKHQNTQKLLKSFPLLNSKPIFLRHLTYFFPDSSNINYSFQLYQNLVDNWLVREEKKLNVNLESLGKFLEQLAIEIYRNREQRGIEKIAQKEIVEIAQKWEIPFENWNLQEHSLLSKDHSGYYKFIHRSIMEYVFVRQLLNYRYNHSLWRISRTALMTTFLIEHVKAFQNHHSSTRVGGSLPVSLRATSIRLNEDEAKFITNKEGRIPHLFQVENIHHDLIVTDYATNLIWEQSGSLRYMRYKNTDRYIEELNHKKNGGYSGWRLPTLEEAVSLVKINNHRDSLHIDSLFDPTQRWIWTADFFSTASRVWCMDFGIGSCSCLAVGLNGYVRAVRSRYEE